MKTLALTFLALVTCSFGCAPTNYDLGPGQGQPLDSGTVDGGRGADGGLDHKVVLTELFAGDPIRHSYDFVRADYGSVIQNGTLYNAGSHVDYSGYYPSDFTVAIQGGNVGAIVDLGLDEAVATSLGVPETSGGGQGFAALVLNGDRFGLPAADAILDRPKSALYTSNDAGSHVTPKVGHVFLLRIADEHDATFDLVVKFFVVSLTAGDRVAFEWMRLR